MRGCYVFLANYRTAFSWWVGFGIRMVILAVICTFVNGLVVMPVGASARQIGMISKQLAFSGTQIALTKQQETIFSNNNIIFYDPDAKNCMDGGSAGLLSGDTAEEKVWNYFVSANIPGVSDNAAVIAGIMGNLYEESNYDPFLRNAKYWGIYQTEPGNIKGLVEAKYGDSYWWFGINGKGVGDPSRYADDVWAGAVEIELNQLTQSNPRFTNDFVNHLGKVSNMSGEDGAASYAELFEVEIERAICTAAMSDCHGYSQYLKDPAVQAYANTELYPSNPALHNIKYQRVEKRSNNAREIYNKYANVGSEVASSDGASSNCIKNESDYPQYFQGDSQWGSEMHGSVGTIRDTGCGPSSMAMLVTVATGQKVTPLDIVNALDGGNYTDGNREELTLKVCEKFGCEAKKVDPGNDENMKQALREGWMLHFSGKEDGHNSNDPAETWVTRPFSEGGHYIGIFYIDEDDNVLIADSGNKGLGRANRKMTWEQATSLRWKDDEFKPIMAIRGNGSCTNTKGFCNSSGGAIVEGGLTWEQAEKIADYYNSDEYTPLEMFPDLPMGTKKNCSSFSSWFASYLTNLDPSDTKRVVDHPADGPVFVDSLVKKNPSVKAGDTPQVWSIFSTASQTTKINGSSFHTGVIVGIEGDEMIYIDAAYGNNAPGRGAKVNREKIPESGIKYAYLADRLNTKNLSAILGS